MRIWVEKLQDKEFEDLRDLGHTGSLNDMQSKYLAAQGYSGSLSDMVRELANAPAGPSWPVTIASGAVSGGPSDESFGVDIPETDDLYIKLTYNMTDTDGHVPFLTFRSGGANGTFVSSLAVRGANNGFDYRLATGPLTTAYPYGISLTSLCTEVGIYSNQDSNVEARIGVGRASTDLSIATYTTPQTATADTTGALASTIDWVGFSCPSATGSGTITNITLSNSPIA